LRAHKLLMFFIFSGLGRAFFSVCALWEIYFCTVFQQQQCSKFSNSQTACSTRCIKIYCYHHVHFFISRSLFMLKQKQFSISNRISIMEIFARTQKNHRRRAKMFIILYWNAIKRFITFFLMLKLLLRAFNCLTFEIILFILFHPPRY
jgi:hypothetical protein